MSGLTPQQEAFAAGVAQGLSQAAAYRRAYPKSAGWKDETVYSRASELIAKSEVSGRVADIMAKAAAANEVTQERIVKELARVAFGNKRAVMRWGPGGVTLIDSDELSDDDAAIVSEVQETRSETGASVKIKTHDKIKALELLGRHVGMFNDKVQVTGADGKPIESSLTVKFVDA